VIAPGTLCRLRNPMDFNISFRRFLEETSEDCDKIDPHAFLFTIISVPHRRENDHYAWGLLSDGRLGFICCKWLIEVREGDE
jgi:hypothetical protein